MSTKKRKTIKKKKPVAKLVAVSAMDQHITGIKRVVVNLGTEEIVFRLNGINERIEAGEDRERALAAQLTDVRKSLGVRRAESAALRGIVEDRRKV